MDLLTQQVLQGLAGGLFLLNKIFFSFSERALNRGNSPRARSFRIAAWVVYLGGLPAWVIIFVSLHDWIAASVEGSGLPAMILGLIMTLKGRDHKSPRWLDILALVCVVLGISCSLYDFGSFRQLSQWLEAGLALGFLIGTYMLAKQRREGYLWYVFMHICCGWLMWIQGYPLLLAQQLLSLVFIADAYYTTRRRIPVTETA